MQAAQRHRDAGTPPEARRRAAEATLRIGGTLALPAVLRKLGFDPATVLAEAGFDPRVFDDPDNRISYAARNRLLAHCADRTACAHFGLLVGEQGSLESLGLVGLLLKVSPDVGAALSGLVRYAHIHVRGAVVTLAADGDLATLGYEVYEPRAEATDQVADGALALMCNLMRSLCGPRWKPVEVRFAHRRPDDLRPYRRFFKAPLSFDTEQNALAFRADWLHRRLPVRNPELRRLVQQQIDALDVRHPDDFPEQVRSVLRTALVTGQAGAGPVAALFGMHSRTLNRRLNAFGTHFRVLVDEGRFEIARQLLENSAMEIGRIAWLLGYAEPSAFTRAFRRWSGTTPARWRAGPGRND
jgi:AraC-like DNA-binding protein